MRFANQLKIINEVQEREKASLKYQLNALLQKVQDAELKNITLDIEVNILKKQLGETHRLIQKLGERLEKAQRTDPIDDIDRLRKR